MAGDPKLAAQLMGAAATWDMTHPWVYEPALCWTCGSRPCRCGTSVQPVTYHITLPDPEVAALRERIRVLEQAIVDLTLEKLAREKKPAKKPRSRKG